VLQTEKSLIKKIRNPKINLLVIKNKPRIFSKEKKVRELHLNLEIGKYTQNDPHKITPMKIEIIGDNKNKGFSDFLGSQIFFVNNFKKSPKG